MVCGRVYCRWPGADKSRDSASRQRAASVPGRDAAFGASGDPRGAEDAAGLGGAPALWAAALVSRGGPRPSSCAGLGGETAGRCAERGGARSRGPEDLAAQERLTVYNCVLRLTCLTRRSRTAALRARPSVNLAPNQRPGAAFAPGCRMREPRAL